MVSRDNMGKDNKIAIKECPELIDWWDAEKNMGVNLEEITAGSNKKFYFKCPKCGKEEYRNMYRFLIKQDDGSYKIMVCQKCNPTKSSLRKGLVDVVPDIGKYWDYEQNEKKPEEYAQNASEKVWTYCPICGTSVKRNVRFSWYKDNEGVGHVLHCRTCGKRSKDNALTELCPDIINYWDNEKNEHTPDYYTISSSKRIYMKCPECETELFRQVTDSVRKTQSGKYVVCSCTDCRKTKETRPENIISNCYPDIDKYWDKSNKYKPNELSRTSKETIRVHCPSCNKLMVKKAANSFEEVDGKWKLRDCQICALKIKISAAALEKGMSVLEECPEIKEWWDKDNNLSPDKVTRGNKSLVSLTCPACQYKMKRDMHSFLFYHRDGKLLMGACPSCGYSPRGNPDDNLSEVCPEIEEWWDYEKNNPFLPEQFTKGSQFAAYLTCPECGMELHTEIHSLVYTNEDGVVKIKHEGKCRHLKARASKNNIVKVYPQIKDWWNYEKNGTKIPEDYTIFAKENIHFTCPTCQMNSYLRISDALRLNEVGVPNLFDCVYCSNRKPIPNINSFKAEHPEMMSEWNWSLNEEEGINPDAIFSSHYDAVNWVCSSCYGEYRQSVRRKVEFLSAGKIACPYCDNRQALSGFNSLDMTHPELMDEWDYENNAKKEIEPDKVTHRFSEPVSWKCKTCHGKYNAIIRNRLIQNSEGKIACPYCDNRKTLSGFNSLDVTYPELMDEWLAAENLLLGLKASELLNNSMECAWWQCQTCNRKYPLAINKRVMKNKRGQNACPFCSGRRWKQIHYI